MSKLFLTVERFFPLIVVALALSGAMIFGKEWEGAIPGWAAIVIGVIALRVAAERRSTIRR